MFGQNWIVEAQAVLQASSNGLGMESSMKYFLRLLMWRSRLLLILPECALMQLEKSGI